MNKVFEKIADNNKRYSRHAIKFVYEGLKHAAGEAPEEPAYISGKAVCESLRKLAIEKWGRLAMLVLNEWGIRKTRDFGEIVYLLVDEKLISAQPGDSIDEFVDVYDFKTAFKDNFNFQGSSNEV